MSIKVCQCCGHPLPPDNVLQALTPLQQRIFLAIKRAGPGGIGSRDIMDIVYANDPTGGPESTNIVPVVVKHMRDRLAPHGLAIRGRRGPGALYRLEKIEEDADAAH